MSFVRRLALLAAAAALPLLPVAPASADTCTTTLIHADYPADAPSSVGCSSASLQVGPDPADPTNRLKVTLDGGASVGANGDESDIETYAWDFGDGATDSTTAPSSSTTHAYAVRGHYLATLTIEAIGGTPLASATADVYASATPTAAFTPPSGILRPGISYQFDASASDAPDAPGGATFHYRWDWGDGTTTDTTNPLAQHTFATDASRNVTLTFVNDLDLASAPVTHTVQVHNQLPAVQLVATPTTVATGQQLTLSAAGSSDPDGTIAEYRWDLDANGSYETSTGTTPSVTAGGYPNAGIMQLSVKVIDDNGGASTRTVSVTITGSDGTGGGGGGTGGGSGGKKSGGGHSAGGGSGGSHLITGSAFAVSLDGSAIQRLRAALRRGVGVIASTNRAATGTLVLTVSARDARMLHLRHRGRKPVTIGTLRISLRAGRTTKPKVRLTRKAARALRRAHPALLRVTVRGRLSAAGARTSAVRIVLLRG